jgi:hypothetical protein
VVLRFGDEAFFDAYNAAAYRDEPGHREGPGPRELRPWERDFIGALPPPPARVLMGGAGTGREAGALSALGYDVVAFDPARSLVETMGELTAGDPSVVPLVGGYCDLPVLRRLDGDEVDLSREPRFAAAYAGWASFSHLRSDSECVLALTRLSALVDGPILLSYLPGPDAPEPQTGFSVHIGFFRQFSDNHVRRLASDAGLEVVTLKTDENWPRAVLRRPETGAREPGDEHPGAQESTS